MSYKAYLIQQFDTTHENIFFKEFSDRLSERFKNDNSSSILIGNLNVNGNQLDALFIKNQQISVIDFKNYGGKLTFSVNNHWAIQNKNETVLVAGGSYNRNPYQQVNQYRRTLIDFFNKENLLSNRNNINFGHISAIVLFQQPIEFDNEQIPKNLAYFHIVDNNNAIERLYNINSKELALSDNEITKILECLNIKEENLFDASKIVIDKNNWESKIKFDLVKRLVQKTPKSNNEIENVLNYYNILLDIESYRESELSNIFTLPINSVLSNPILEIDFNAKEEILKELTKNQSEKFPKNILVGLSFSIGSQNKILLYQIILASEINYSEKINQVKASNFELYSPSFQQLNLSENTIEELNSKISLFSTLQEKIDYLITELETLKLKFSPNLSLAFSDKNLTNSHLSSELNRLRKKHIPELSTNFISNYLLNKPIINKTDTFNKFIKITHLNNLQEDAVKASLQNTLTVITGPPGTGKTQVVLNIIANAIINNQKILFASKNNKAVDNVTERFISDYLLRVGANEIIEANLKPKLDSFIHQNYSFNKDIDKTFAKISELQKRIDEINTFFKKLILLPNEIEEHKQKIKNLTIDLENYKSKINSVEKNLFFDQNLEFKLNKNNINLIVNDLQKRNSNFLSRLFFKWFSQSKKLQEIVVIENQFDNSITDFINSLNPLFENGKTNINLIINHLIGLLKIYDNYVKHTVFKNNNTNNLKIQNDNLSFKQTELNWIVENKQFLELELSQKNTEFIEVSKEYVKQFINNKLSETSSAIIANFKSYLGNIPFMDWEYSEYENACQMFIDKFLAISVTSLSAKKAISLSKEIFDLLVIDEASQCDIASAIPLIFRAKKIVVIGDPQQLKHITSVDKFEENYVLNHLKLSEIKYNYVQSSLFDYAYNIANISNINSYFLKEHYRCHPKIIDFSNVFFYNNELIVKTQENQFEFGDKGIIWYDVKGTTAKDLNFNKAEKDFVIKLGIDLLKKYPKAEIGITTPFKDQETSLKLEKHNFDSISKKLYNSNNSQISGR
jgi:hypothetical protein